MRLEYKYIIDLALKPYLEHVLLSGGFSRDKYSQKPEGYLVNSIYFDTQVLDTFNDKLDGVSKRFKLRLRYYGDSPSSFVLEVKKKDAYLGLKDRFTFACLEVENYFERNSGDLAKFLEVNFPQFIPTMYVGYDRVAFHIGDDTDMRISMDSNVTWCLPPFSYADLTKPHRNQLQPVDKFVLEIKCQREMPKEFQKLLKQIELRWVENSKYANCLSAALGT